MVSRNGSDQPGFTATISTVSIKSQDFGLRLRHGRSHAVASLGKRNCCWIRPFAGRARLLSLRQLQPLTCGSVDHLPFASGSFDLVTSFDVLYAQSVPDVLAAMKELTRVLSPKGYLLLRLPAYDWLRGRHDIAVQTAHRFSMGAVSELLHQCHLTILHKSYANTFLFPLALMKRLIEKTQSEKAITSDLTVEFGWLDRVLGKIIKFRSSPDITVEPAFWIEPGSHRSKTMTMIHPQIPLKISGISAVFPAFNDGGTIPSMVLTALMALRQVTDDYEIIVVNDGSADYHQERT